MKRPLGDYPYEEHVHKYKRRILPWGAGILAAATLAFFLVFRDHGKVTIFYVFFVGLVLATMVHTHLFLWLVGKAKPKADKRDFFTTWGRSKVRSKIDEYFEEPYKSWYRMTMVLTYAILIAFCLLLFFSFFELA